MTTTWQIWLTCHQPFPQKYSASLTDSDAHNWDQIKNIFRKFKTIPCSWMREILQTTTDFNLDDHNDCFRAKVKYDILINGTPDMMMYFNQPQKWLKLSREFFIELARHKCISYFNTRISTNFFEYLDECILELRDMRQEMVKEGVSLYDFVLRDKKDYEIEEYDEGMIEKYKIYGDVVKNAMESALERKKLLKELMDSQIYTELKDGTTVTLDCDSVYVMAQFMTNLDLSRLLNVF